MNKYRFHIIATITSIILMIIMVWANVYFRSSRHFNEAEEFFKDDKLIQAITSYESSAHAYTPGNPYVSKSMERLWEIGELLEKRHSDPTYPLIAYRSLRSSVYAIRSFYMPHKDWISRCDRKIGELVNIQKLKMEEKLNKATE